MSLLPDIKDLCTNLPSKDQKLADSFIIKRDFRALLDLVSSCIKMTKKNMLRENPKSCYNNLDLEKLQALESSTILYLSAIDPDWNDSNDEEDIDEEEY